MPERIHKKGHNEPGHKTGQNTRREKCLMGRNSPRFTSRSSSSRAGRRPGWSRRLFRADAQAPGEVFSIVIPPPNVTGYIHIGHMLEHTQIDALTRWHRMRGERTLWLPGMDHAGISTQVVVERELAKQGLTRKALGREEFERRVWEWKAHSGGTIKKQMIRLGDSCDWSREKFTLDPPLYRAVSGSFSAALPRRADLSRPLHRELVPALPDGVERSRDRARGAQRASLAHSLSGGGFERNRLSWPRRGRKRCWAIRLWR